MATVPKVRTSRRTGCGSTRNKVLIDPYAKAIAGTVDWRHPVFGYMLGGEDEDLAIDER